MTASKRRRLTDVEVRAILHAHTVDHVKAAALAREYGVHPNAVYNIIWGRTHRSITKGRNVSKAPARKADVAARIRDMYRQTGSKAATARELGVSRPTVTYHLNKDEA